MKQGFCVSHFKLQQREKSYTVKTVKLKLLAQRSDIDQDNHSNLTRIKVGIYTLHRSYDVQLTSRNRERSCGHCFAKL